MIAISKRGRIIATLVPVARSGAIATGPVKPDIMARLSETWGTRIFSVEEVAAMRSDELAGDLG